MCRENICTYQLLSYLSHLLRHVQRCVSNHSVCPVNTSWLADISSVSWPVAVEAARAWRWFHFPTETTVIRAGSTWGHCKIVPITCLFVPTDLNGQRILTITFTQHCSVPSQLITIIYVQGLICIRITPKHFGTGQLQGGRSEAMLILSSMKKQKLGGWKGVWRRK